MTITDSDQLVADLTDDIDPETFIEDIATTELPPAVAIFAQRYDEEIGIRDEQGCSVQEAVIRSCELIEAETRRFEALSHRLTVATDTDAPLQAYITGLEQVVSGNLAWSKETARYGATD